MNSFAYPAIKNDSENNVHVTETATGIIVQNDRFHASFSKITGSLITWEVDDKELLVGPLEPYFWKPANDNQKMSGFEH